MNSSKLMKLYESIGDVNDYVASARELRRSLGSALNSLVVLERAPLEDKEKIESTIRDLRQIFNLAMELEHELEIKAKDQPTFP